MDQEGSVNMVFSSPVSRGVAVGPQGQSGGPKRGFDEPSLSRNEEEQKKAKTESFHLLN